MTVCLVVQQSIIYFYIFKYYHFFPLKLDSILPLLHNDIAKWLILYSY